MPLSQHTLALKLTTYASSAIILCHNLPFCSPNSPIHLTTASCLLPFLVKGVAGQHQRMNGCTNSFSFQKQYSQYSPLLLMSEYQQNPPFLKMYSVYSRCPSKFLPTGPSQSPPKNQMGLWWKKLQNEMSIPSIDPKYRSVALSIRPHVL